MNEEDSISEETAAAEGGSDLNHGTQPLDAIMKELGMVNHDLVAAGTQPFTHKTVVRARKGRQLTPKMKVRLTEALNAYARSRGNDGTYGVKQLFNY